MFLYFQRTKQSAVIILLLVTLFSCDKKKRDDQTPPPPPQPASAYEPFTLSHNVQFCSPAYISDLKIRSGANVGSVAVANDSQYLYLTYRLNDNWYLAAVHSYAGPEMLIPKTQHGNPNYQEFPGKKTLNPCGLSREFTYRIPLNKIETDDNVQCPTGKRFFIAMRAAVKEIIPPDDCVQGNVQDAWAAPVLINPGNASEWATAFYYCKQDCTPWCAYGQGYWFAKPNVNWCQPSVSFGNLTITKADARALWPAQNNWVKKAFFQTSAAQLSLACFNTGGNIPVDIAAEYNYLTNFLSSLIYTDIQNGSYPAGTDIDAIKQATGHIEDWMCLRKCNSADDPTDCN